MSNASNLSTLANVLDDGSDGQFLKSTGSGGVAFDTVAAGAVVYATADLLPLSGNSAGDMAYVTATNRFYINNGSGWYSVSLVNTNPNITSVQDASSNTTPFTLATDGTATVITVTAADPEEVPLTYGYSVTSGSLNGSTVAQGTGSNTNVFTVTPHASQDATFTITFTASDGINQATSANAFSLSFVTVVTDSKYTTLLATATGTSDNNNITYIDGSGNTQNVTVNGDAYAGTFSPYRSGGYSTYFDGTTDYIEHQGTFTLPSGTNANWTIECWVNLDQVNLNQGILRVSSTVANGNNDDIYFSEQGGYLVASCKAGGINSGTSAFAMTANTWHHIAMVKNNGTIYLYNNGVYCGSLSDSNDYSGYYYVYGGLYYSSSYCFAGYLTDFRISNTADYTSGTSNFTVPDERLSSDSSTLFLTCHLPYITDGSSNDHSITVNGDVSTKPFSPYDYDEYSATGHGGSVYFDGTGDTLEIPHSTNVGAFGTNNFTVQLWYYTEAIGNQDYLIDFRQYGANGDYLSISKNGSNKIVVAEGGSNRITGTKDVSVGQWFFITVHRDSGSLKLFVNGEQDGSTYSDSTNYVAGSSGNFIIGKNNGGASYLMQGYLSDIRVTHGSALDGTTVPTAPLSSTGASLHLKGTDASIIDKSQGFNLKLIGNTTGSTDLGANSDAYSGSGKYIKFDGNGDYIQASLTEDNLPNEFTIEGWVYTPTVSGPKGIFGIGTTAFPSTDAGIAVFTRSSTYNYDYAFYCDGNQVNSTTPPTANTWQHFALVRNSSNLMSLYLDGSSIASSTISGTVNGSIITIGGYYSSSYLWNGYIQDFRITKGLARYTANFTPPTASLEG